MAADDNMRTISLRQHLPSTTTKSMNRCWDRAGVSCNAAPNALRDFRWTHSDPIVFESRVSTREYASRQLGRRTDPPPAQERTDSSNLMRNPSLVSASSIDSSGDYQTQLKQKDAVIRQQNAAIKSAEQTRDEAMAKLRELELRWKSKEADIKTQEKNIRSTVADVVAQARSNERDSLQEKFKQRENTVAKREGSHRAAEAELNRRRTKFEQEAATLAKKITEFDSTVEAARTAAQQDEQAKNKASLDAAEEERRQAQALHQTAASIRSEATRERQQEEERHRETLSAEEKRLQREWDDRKLALEKDMQSEYQLEMRKAKLAEYRETHERRTYEQYSAVWSGFHASSKKLLDGQFELVLLLRAQLKTWQRIVTVFDSAKIYLSLSKKYPKLARKIKQYLASSLEQTNSISNRVEHGRIALRFERQQRLRRLGHHSRSLTRFHRYQNPFNDMDLSILKDQVLSESPLDAEIDALKKKTLDVREILMHTTNHTDKAQLKDESQALAIQIDRIKAAKRWAHAVRREEGLKLLRQENVVEKEIFVTLDDPSRQYALANQAWKDFTYENPFKVDGSEIDEKQQNQERHDIGQAERQFLRDLLEYRAFLRERRLVKTQLGEYDGRSPQFDAAIDKKIEEAKSFSSDKLRAFVDLPRTRAASFKSRSRPSPRPEKDLERTTSPINREIEELTRKTSDKQAYANEAERQKDKDKLAKLKLQHQQFTLFTLKHQRDTMRGDNSSDSTKTVALNKEIEGLESSPAPAGRRLGRLRPSSRKKPAKPASPKKSKSSEAGLTKANESKARSSLNFKPTQSKQSWQQLSAHHFCYSFGSSSKADPQPHESNALVMSRILGKRPDEPVSVPRALRVYSLHSISMPEIDERHLSGPRVHSDMAYASDSQANAFSGSSGLPQSSAETVSDPESDDSYDVSDSEFSASSDELESVEGSQVPATVQSTASTQTFEDALESNPDVAPENQEVDTNMTYKISAEDYRRAVMASQSTNAAFWTYKLYKNGEGDHPKIHYCTNLEAAEAQAKQFLNEPILGFDLEWEIGAMPGKSSLKNCVSLVQIASESKIGLFQLAMFKGDTAEELMPPSLRQILESRDIAKAGVNVSGDGNRIEKCFGFNVRGLFELSHLYNVVTWSESKPERVNKKLFKLADQVQNILLLPMKKDAVRVSAWSKRLRAEQTEYAASDAYAGLQLYHALEARRKKMKPAPPRPAFWEDQQPLVLGDGTVMIPKRIPRKKPGEAKKVVDEDEDDEYEEYFDAVETLDPYEADSSIAGVPLEGLSISYPTLPKLEEDADEPEQAQKPSEASSTKAANPPKTQTPIQSSPALMEADTWAQTFRNSLPATHNLKSKQASLRAYHLWHHQSLDCTEIASLLRDPPLNIRTIANYVLHAVNEGGSLDYDQQRVVAALEMIPESVRGRYWRVVQRAERADVERDIVRSAV